LRGVYAGGGMEEEEVVVIVVKGGGSYASLVGMEGRVRPVPLGDIPEPHLRVANLGGDAMRPPPPSPPRVAPVTLVGMEGCVHPVPSSDTPSITPRLAGIRGAPAMVGMRMGLQR
jgi:hypothetical protein